MRPCAKKHPELKCVIGEPWVLDRDCRLCWLYAHHLDFRKLWKGDDNVTEVKLPTTPGLIDCGKNAAAAVIRFVASGAVLLDDREKNKRLAICEKCPFLRGDRCGKCGCKLPYKTAMASEHCPIGHW